MSASFSIDARQAFKCFCYWKSSTLAWLSPLAPTKWRNMCSMLFWETRSPIFSYLDFLLRVIWEAVWVVLYLRSRTEVCPGWLWITFLTSFDLDETVEKHEGEFSADARLLFQPHLAGFHSLEHLIRLISGSLGLHYQLLSETTHMVFQTCVSASRSLMSPFGQMGKLRRQKNICESKQDCVQREDRTNIWQSSSDQTAKVSWQLHCPLLSTE